MAENYLSVIKREETMSISRRDFVKQIGFGMAAAGLAAHNLACAANSGGGSEKLLAANPKHPEPAPLEI